MVQRPSEGEVGERVELEVRDAADTRRDRCLREMLLRSFERERPQRADAQAELHERNRCFRVDGVRCRQIAVVACCAQLREGQVLGTE